MLIDSLSNLNMMLFYKFVQNQDMLFFHNTLSSNKLIAMKDLLKWRKVEFLSFYAIKFIKSMTINFVI